MYFRSILYLLVLGALGFLGCGSQNPVKSEPDPESGLIPEYLYQGDLVVVLPGGAKMAFMQIQPGSFTMGGASVYSDVYPFQDEAPQHQVTLTKGFYIGKYEVTRDQWESVMGTERLPEALEMASGKIAPVVNISWDDCQEFVNRLNQTGSMNTYRLPTEAEWEYACRAGTTIPWSYGDVGSTHEYHDTHVWYEANSSGRPHDVGLKKPNAWGLYDMHGNVAEWVNDWFNPYTADPQIDPKGLDGPMYPYPGFDRRSMRGGSFKSRNPLDFRSARRTGATTETLVDNVGLRIVLEIF